MRIPFEPKTPFEGFVASELYNLKKVVSNHLKHHWYIEGALILFILIYFIKEWFLK